MVKDDCCNAGNKPAVLTALRQLFKASDELATVFSRLSSGQRINTASDDAAGLAIVNSLSTDSRVFNQGVRNLNDGISLLNIADNAIENLSSIVIRLEELASQAANGIYGDTQREALDDEAQALAEEFARITRSTEFNGQRLLTGEISGVNLQAGYSILETGVGGALGQVYSSVMGKALLVIQLLSPPDIQHSRV